MNTIQNSRNIFTGNVDTGGGDILLKDNYYKSAEYKDFQEKIELLEIALQNAKTDEDRLKRSKQLNEERDKLEGFKKEVIALAETFQRINLDTERLQKAKQHFDKGEFKEARAVLDAEAMGKELDALLAEKEQLENKTATNTERLSNKADEFLILARLTAVDFDNPKRFEETVGCFELSLKAERSGRILFGYAKFLQLHNQNSRAVPLYKESLELLQELEQTTSLSNLLDISSIFNNLGVLQHYENKFIQAEKNHCEALKIRRQLAHNDSLAYLPYIAETLSNLGTLQKDKNEFIEASKSYNEALQIIRHLEQKNPNDFQHNLAEVLNNLGLLQNEKGELELAETSYYEALKIYTHLFDESNPDYLLQIGGVLNNLGLLLHEKNELQQARKNYCEAVKIYRQLASINPYLFSYHLAMTLNSLGLLQSSTGEIENAEKHYFEALKIYQKLVKHNPETFLPHMARTLLNLSIFYLQSKKDKVLSLKFSDEALDCLLPFENIPYL